MKVGSAISNNPVSQSPSVISSDDNSFANNLSKINNSSSISLLSLKYDKNDSLDFGNYAFNKSQQESSPSLRELIEKYKTYRYKTIGEYREAKHYPSGKDIRPESFDPTGRHVAAHGTNFEALLRSSINCNLQITPGLRAFKLQGKQHESGESAIEGTTHLNCKYVSTVGLGGMTSDFSAVKGYARLAASVFLKGARNNFNTIPVVIIGDGIGEYSVMSDVPNEVGYKRLNIRIVAFKNEEDKKVGIDWLGKVRDELGVSNVTSLRFCVFEDLDATIRNYGLRNSKSSSPRISSLWEKSESLNALEFTPK